MNRLIRLRLNLLSVSDCLSDIAPRLMKVAVIACLNGLVLLPNAYAAEVISNREVCGASPCAYFNGEIKLGDLIKLKSLFDSPTRPRSFNAINQGVFTLNLNSPGGSLEEAMQIGRWVRSKKISTSMSNRSECFSACVYILAAGVSKMAVGSFWGSKVGIHRPYLTRMPQEGVQIAMRKALADSKAYFAETNIPEQLADAMFSISPVKTEILSDDRISYFRLIGLDIVFDEEMELKGAALYGMSRQQYMQNKKLFEDEAKEKCFYPVLRGEAAQECIRSTAKKYGLHESQMKQSR